MYCSRLYSKELLILNTTNGMFTRQLLAVSVTANWRVYCIIDECHGKFHFALLSVHIATRTSRRLEASVGTALI